MKNDKIIIDYVYKLEEFEQAIKIIEEKTNGNLKLVNEIKNKTLTQKNIEKCITKKTSLQKNSKKILIFSNILSKIKL